jgi:FdhD protein
MIKFQDFDKYYKEISSIIQFTALKTQNIDEKELKEEQVTTVTEASITIVINDTRQIGVICTPQQIEGLIVGHLICEGYIKSISSIEKISYQNNSQFHVKIKEDVNQIPVATEIRTAGMMGIKNSQNKVNPKLISSLSITPKIMFYAQDTMTKKGVIWPVSGGTHMSGLFNAQGNLLYFAEDVGRHNTIDKIIGEAIIKQENMSQLFSCTSGRVSGASVIKYVRAGIPILVSVSAPTAEGIKLAQQTNITVVGFSRKPAFTVYSVPDRIKK